jgi:hypothetical protein
MERIALIPTSRRRGGTRFCSKPIAEKEYEQGDGIAMLGKMRRLNNKPGGQNSRRETTSIVAVRIYHPAAGLTLRWQALKLNEVLRQF